mmetsp:Transcript_65819/g.182380  ORF Transcript_65819/g.182380 Transcript_65819/m.182380 type:complete len:242 (+) Transcript_65819:149-874(+)
MQAAPVASARWRGPAAPPLPEPWRPQAARPSVTRRRLWPGLAGSWRPWRRGCLPWWPHSRCNMLPICARRTSSPSWPAGALRPAWRQWSSAKHKWSSASSSSPTQCRASAASRRPRTSGLPTSRLRPVSAWSSSGPSAALVTTRHRLQLPPVQSGPRPPLPWARRCLPQRPHAGPSSGWRAACWRWSPAAAVQRRSSGGCRRSRSAGSGRRRRTRWLRRFPQRRHTAIAQARVQPWMRRQP